MTDIHSDLLDASDPLMMVISEHHRHQTFEQERGWLSERLNWILLAEMKQELDRAYGTELTRKSYIADFNRFKQFCTARDLHSQPTSPEVIAWYILERACEGARPKTLERAVAAIKWMHSWRNVNFPADETMIRAALNRARRKWQDEQNANKAAAMDEPKQGTEQ